MNRKQIILVISILLAICIFGCRQRSINDKEKFNTVIKAINAIFEIEMPLKIDQITVFRDGWQGHGFHVYFEISSEYLNQIKTERYEWKEIPEEYRLVISATNPENGNEIQGGQWHSLYERANSFFDHARTILKIHNNESDRIQWYYYSYAKKKGAPEKSILMLISENQNGIIRCYFSDTDIRDYEDRGKLYDILTSDKSITLFK